MKDTFRKYLYLALAVLLTVAAALSENGLIFRNPEYKLVDKFQKKLNQKELKLEADLEEIRDMTRRPGFTYNYLSDLALYNQSMKNSGTGYQIGRASCRERV